MGMNDKPPSGLMERISNLVFLLDFKPRLDLEIIPLTDLAVVVPHIFLTLDLSCYKGLTSWVGAFGGFMRCGGSHLGI